MLQEYRLVPKICKNISATKKSALLINKKLILELFLREVFQM